MPMSLIPAADIRPRRKSRSRLTKADYRSAGSPPLTTATRTHNRAATRPGPKWASWLAFRVFGIGLADAFFGISNRRRNHVPTARPLAQINGAATLAAEREFRVRALDGFLADRAAKFYGPLARHTIFLL